MFDRAKFVTALERAYPGYADYAAIDYPANVFDPSDSSRYLDLDVVLSSGVDAGVERYLDSFRRELFFTKNPDWSGEREWRACVFHQPLGAEVSVSVEGGVVAGIVLGVALDEAQLPDIRALATQLGIRDSVAKAYLHQLNVIDVVPIDVEGQQWRFLDRTELKSLGYLGPSSP